MLCASPSMPKVLHGFPEWFSKPNEKGPSYDPVISDVYYGIVFKYFTFQGVVWHYQNDQEAMSVYFKLVMKAINILQQNHRTLDIHLTCLKWIIECYAQLEDYAICENLLSQMKANSTFQFQPFWIEYYKETLVSISMAKKSFEIVPELSPPRSRLLVDVATPKTSPPLRALPRYYCL